MSQTLMPLGVTRRVCLAVLCYVAIIGFVFSPKGDERPHIICYVADDFGVGDSGCYGHPFSVTPNIDALASEGMRFTRAFAGSPTCAPSRSIFYTGLMSARTGAHPNHWPVKEGTRSIGHYLRELGYHVAVFNKIHVSPPTAFPFERVKASRQQEGGGGRCLDHRVLDKWLAAKREASPDQPLCLFLCDNNTHLVWPDQQHSKRDEISVPPYLPDSATTRDSLARYYSEVELLDQRVGECVEVLKKHDLFDESLFLFTADQGPAWMRAKWTLYDSGLQVPLIARWPSQIGAGRVSTAMVSLVDLPPTFIDVAGGQPIGGLDGQSFLPSLRDARRGHRDYVFGTHTGDGTMNNYPSRAIRSLRYKLIWNLRSDLECTTHLTKATGLDRKNIWQAWMKERQGDPRIGALMDTHSRRPELELYDLESDPYELVNLASSPERLVVRNALLDRLTNWMRDQGDRRRDMTSFLEEQ